MHRGKLNSKCSINWGNRARENNSKSIRRFPLLFTSCVRQVYCARIGRLQTRYIRASSPQILYIFFIFNGTIAVILNYVAGIPARSHIRICQKNNEKEDKRRRGRFLEASDPRKNSGLPPIDFPDSDFLFSRSFTLAVSRCRLVLRTPLQHSSTPPRPLSTCRGY